MPISVLLNDLMHEALFSHALSRRRPHIGLRASVLADRSQELSSDHSSTVSLKLSLSRFLRSRVASRTRRALMDRSLGEK